jgi:hypothetical protein
MEIGLSINRFLYTMKANYTWATHHSPRRAALKIKGLPRPLTSREAGRGERVFTVMEKAAKTPS